MSFWCLQKNNEKFDKFLPQKLKSGQINKVKAFSYNTMIIWAVSLINTLYGAIFDHFLDSGAEVCQIFVGFLENLRHENDILKLSDL